ncbi:hypothetical protein [Catenulispora subtropica]|uniref:Uncharacterized protein n=1 Tax=Catenulispora subtropica TaxID=450798 RepID=A0ABP5E1H5_9ACTN
MDRVDLEALVVRLVDHVQFKGYAVEHEVEDPALLRQLIREEAHTRSLRVRTGIAKGDRQTVWACRPDDVIKFLRPTTKEDEARAVEAMEHAIRQGKGQEPPMTPV